MNVRPSSLDKVKTEEDKLKEAKEAKKKLENEISEIDSLIKRSERKSFNF